MTQNFDQKKVIYRGIYMSWNSTSEAKSYIIPIGYHPPFPQVLTC